MQARNAYQELETRFRRWSAVKGAAGVLHWDHAVMMPPGAAAARSEQLATLDVIAHQMMTDPAMADLLMEAKARRSELNHWQQANLAEMWRIHTHAGAVPEELVEALTRAGSESEVFWRTARDNNDFRGWAPHLKKVVDLVRQMAEIKADVLGTSLYDAMLDQYDPGRKSEEVDRVFGELETFLPEFTQQVLEKQAQEQLLPLEGPFPVEQQRELGISLMEQAGFDFDRGRLDVSHHPFCGGGIDDIRITTAYDENDFTFAMMGVLHETGHAMYDLGLPEEWRWQPVGDARGMSIHESQSLLFEMQVCRSRDFLEFAAPLIREAFGRQGEAWEPQNLHKHYTRVKKDFIRIDADEVTYPAHVILRYRLEKAMLEKRLEVDDLPDAWNEGMQELLGITPPDHRRGCMQDIHWADGSIGYFPTYTLGAIIAAQLYTAAKDQQPDIPTEVRKGNFAPLFLWLREEVHGLGSSLSSEELVEKATGKPLDVNAFTGHLKRRYLAE